jgi:RNA-directed DNA polymerase
MSKTRILSLNRLAWTLGIPREVLESLAAVAGHHYRPFLLERQGKKPRLIDNPDRCLKDTQRKIYKRLLKDLKFPEYLHGGIKGKSPKTNAAKHLGKRLVVRLDLEDFFPSITNRQVYSVWSRNLDNSPPVSRLLTLLTTYRRRLPQGAPTSTPVILDIGFLLCWLFMVNPRSIRIPAEAYSERLLEAPDELLRQEERQKAAK